MLKKLLNAAFFGLAVENFSSEDVNQAAINKIMETVGLTENSTAREIRAVEPAAFALIEEAIDEILPKKLENVLGEFAEVQSFARDAAVQFNIEKIGKNRAKLTISKGARGGIYRAAKLSNKYFTIETSVYTVSVYETLEDILLGKSTLAELWNNILEGFEEIVYKEVFNALATAEPAATGYDRISDTLSATTTTKDALGDALDKVIPYVRQYGQPTIFGSYQAVSGLSNPTTDWHIESEDARERRQYGFIQLYKGVRIVELPNYLIGTGNDEWFYDPSYVFVMPSGAKPVKVALQGDLYIKDNEQAVGSIKREAHKLMGVGVAMANNFAVIQVTDLED